VVKLTYVTIIFFKANILLYVEYYLLGLEVEGFEQLMDL